MRAFISLLFGILALFKFIAAYAESPNFLVSLTFMAMFGSPQLAWLILCQKAKFTSIQSAVAVFVAIAFFLSSVYFGYFPGAPHSSWNTGAHFGTPIAFLTEWVIAAIFYQLFKDGNDKA